jgi:hypothetical protein
MPISDSCYSWAARKHWIVLGALLGGALLLFNISIDYDSLQFTTILIRKEKTYNDQRAAMLYENFQKALHESLLRPMIDNYGPDAPDIYFHPTILHSQFFRHHPSSSPYNATPANTSSSAKLRLHRRLQIAILKAQFSDGDSVVPFTWVSSGDSNAAAHGNLFQQSATVIMESLVQPLFASLNIVFRAKNYAYGSSQSAPEFALCQTAIYGTNIDILTWDYAMSDGDDSWRYELFTQRMGVHPTFPIQVDISPPRQDIYPNLPIFNLDYKLIRQLIPDSTPLDEDLTNLNTTVDSFPPGIQFFKCKGYLETGEPCAEYKWNTSFRCNATKQQTSWHPGWKDHMFKGYILASFLENALKEALEELLDLNSSRTAADANMSLPNMENAGNPSMTRDYLNYLIRIEETENEYFIQSLPPSAPTFLDVPTDVYSTIQRSRGMVCHTALVPAEARFEGIVQMQPFLIPLNDTLSNDTLPTTPKYVPRPRQQLGNYTHGGMYSPYERGYKSQADLPPPNPLDNATEFFLVATTFEKDLGLCIHQQQDFRDYFFIRKEDGWMTLFIPNDLEVEKYRRPGKSSSTDKDDQRKGIVVACLKFFVWNENPKDMIPWNLTSFSEDMNIVINGVLGKKNPAVAEADPEITFSIS